ncbi:hypothetical protein EBZ80_16180 [bacterium]|nr:hypothetical protein [bacterium]
MESDRIEPGKKYNVMVQGSDSSESETIQLWMDDSNPGEVVIYQCRDWVLVNKFRIGAITESGVKGTKVMQVSRTDSTFAASMEFDTTVAGEKWFTMSSLISLVDRQVTRTFRNYSSLRVSDNGVSYAGSAIAGSVADGVTLGDRLFTKFQGGAGQSAMVADGVWDGLPYSRATRASFDATGAISPAVELPEASVVVKTDIPDLLPADFAPEAPVGWNCADGKTLTIDLTDAAVAQRHDSCVSTFAPAVLDCRDASIYDDGTDEPALRN